MRYALSGGGRETVATRGFYVSKAQQARDQLPGSRESTLGSLVIDYQVEALLALTISHCLHRQLRAEVPTNHGNASHRQIRWLHRLQEFDLSIHHIPGKTNIVADILSQMHEDRKSEELYGPVLKIYNIIGSSIAPAQTVLDDWMDEYRQDPEVFTYFFNPATP